MPGTALSEPRSTSQKLGTASISNSGELVDTVPNFGGPTFGSSHASLGTAMMAQYRTKLAEVTRLMKLLNDETSPKLEPELVTILEQLKVYGRDPTNADPIYCKEGIKTLSRYAFESESASISREALRCIANALFLAPNLRQAFVDLDYPTRAADRLKNQNADDEFLISRILFLLTYQTTFDLGPLFDDHGLAESVNIHISRHADLLTNSNDGSSSTVPEDPIQMAALSESLKLLFNLLNFYPNYATNFAASLGSILRILNSVNIPKPPLQPPINYLINALVNLDLDDTTSTVPNVEKLVAILDQAVSAYQPTQLETLAVPLITVLRKVFDVAPQEAKRTMQLLLLPTDADRDLPIGQSDTLSSRLLRLSASPVAPNLREGIPSLMFELSGKNASQFVQNVGYGFAAGYLMSHDIPIPESAKHTGSEGDEDGSNIQINPITGQRLDKEPVGEEPEMTMEEKEREAERLFVLFERLRATGVIDIQNPVRQAMEEGRFDNRIEEIDDSD